MKSQNLKTNAHGVRTGILQSGGGDGCDLENYLDDWLRAKRELQEKFNKSSGE